MVQVSQQLRDPTWFGVVGQHGQVLDLGPDGEVGFVGRVLPLQGNQHIGKGGGASHDLPDLLLQVLGLAALQEQIALDSSTSTGLAGHSEKPAKILSELAEVLACELRQVHHNLGGGNSLRLLRPASLRVSGLLLLLLLLSPWVLGVLRVIVLRGRSRSHRRRLIIGGVSA